MKHTALILTLLFALLLLTACHTDNDPWPVANELDTFAATSVPTEAPVYTDEPVSTLAPRLTPEPTEGAAYTDEPVATQAPMLTPEPTEVPGGSEEPGING